MKKEDLNFGNVVELSNGDLCLIMPVVDYSCSITLKDYLKYNFVIQLRDIVGGKYIEKLSSYNDDLTMKDSDYSIMKVYKDYTLEEVLWERKSNKPLLTDKEREWLKKVIKPFRDNIKYIVKGEDWLLFYCKFMDRGVYMGEFKFENLENNKHYSLTELGL